MATEQLVSGPPRGVWQELADNLSFVRYVPRPVGRDVVEERAFVRRSGEPYHVLKHRTLQTYLSLPEDAYALWQMMDGVKPIRQIVVEYFLARNQLVTGLLRSVVGQLRDKGFLEDRLARVFGTLAERRRRGPSVWANAVAASIIARNLVVFHGGDAAIGAVYRRVGWLFCTLPAKILMGAAVLLGLIAWGAQVLQGKYSLLTTDGSYLAGFVALFLLNALMISLHELGHAIAVKHQGRQVNGLGLLLYYATPCAYVDTTDIWMADRKGRILASFAGPFVTLTLAGLMGLAALFATEASLLGDLAFKAATVWFIGGLIQFIPLLELDGYFMLVDLLEMPLLRARSFDFLRNELPRKFHRRSAWTSEERLLGLFGVLAAVFSGVVLVVALWGWKVRGVGLARELWNLPAWYGKPLLILIFLIFVGPVVLAIASLFIDGFRWLLRYATSRDQRTTPGPAC